MAWRDEPTQRCPAAALPRSKAYGVGAGGSQAGLRATAALACSASSNARSLSIDRRGNRVHLLPHPRPAGLG